MQGFCEYPNSVLIKLCELILTNLVLLICGSTYYNQRGINMKWMISGKWGKSCHSKSKSKAWRKRNLHNILDTKRGLEAYKSKESAFGNFQLKRIMLKITQRSLILEGSLVTVHLSKESSFRDYLRPGNIRWHSSRYSRLVMERTFQYQQWCFAIGSFKRSQEISHVNGLFGTCTLPQS